MNQPPISMFETLNPIPPHLAFAHKENQNLYFGLLNNLKFKQFVDFLMQFKTYQTKIRIMLINMNQILFQRNWQKM